MAEIDLDEQFKNYLLTTYPLSESLLMNILDDLGEYFGTSLEEYIPARQRELHQQGKKNDEIYRIIQEEVKGKLFPGPDLSIRQIRRAIYG